jgi:hypothetical protein
MDYIKRLTLIICFLLFGFHIYVQAAAMPYMNKSKIRVAVIPGKTNYGEIMVENPAAQDMAMRVYLEDWYYQPAADGSKAFVPANSTPHSCAGWLTFSPAEFTLPPFGRQAVNYAIKLPPDASGSYYAALFFESAAGNMAAGQEGMAAAININIRIGVLFYVEAEGTIKRTGILENLALKQDKAAGGLSIQMDFRNTGNVDITAGGSFHIIDRQGLVLARNEFDNVYTFPGDTAKLQAKSKKLLPKGRYDLVLTFDLGKAWEELGISRGPVVTKEAEIEVDASGEVVRIGGLK